MNFAVILIISAFIFASDAFIIKQLHLGEAYARDCVYKVGISPLTINRLRKGDFSNHDEKSQVSFNKIESFSVIINLKQSFSALLNVSWNTAASCIVTN